MNQLQGFSLTNLDAMGKNRQPDSSTPSIVKNIQRMSEKYQKYIDSEISADQVNQIEQAEKVKKLKGKSKKKGI